MWGRGNGGGRRGGVVRRGKGLGIGTIVDPYFSPIFCFFSAGDVLALSMGAELDYIEL